MFENTGVERCTFNHYIVKVIVQVYVQVYKGTAFQVHYTQVYTIVHMYVLKKYRKLVVPLYCTDVNKPVLRIRSHFYRIRGLELEKLDSDPDPTWTCLYNVEKTKLCHFLSSFKHLMTPDQNSFCRNCFLDNII